MSSSEWSNGRRSGMTLALAATALVTGATTIRASEPQPPPDRNEVYVEYLGNTILGANYARGLSDNLSVRVGAGLVPLVGTTALAMPMLHLNRGWTHDVEVGAGGQQVWLADGQAFSALTGTAGYRFRSNSGFTFRAVGTVMLFGQASELSHVSYGVCFGKTF